MIELIAENLAPIMFASLIVFLLLGYPVAFSLAANGLLFFIIGVELAPLSDSINLSWPLLNALPDRFWGVMSNETLLAIPFFTFMGIVLEKSGMAEDLLDTIGQLFGPIRGGLAYAVIFVGALLAATTGVVAAGIAYGAHVYLYPTQGENADILGGTVGVVFIYIVALLDKNLKVNAMSRLAQQVIIVLIPPLALIFLVLGTIFLGIATPTEGGAMGAVGALFLAAAKGRLNLGVVRSALTSTTRLSS
ncbi:MAG TPA: TRAP transporter large permease subunit, partial [Mycoplana sp.]|nr:TRAP transporter large permease subunit [Mycoplana sp.]